MINPNKSWMKEKEKKHSIRYKKKNDKISIKKSFFFTIILHVLF